VGLEEIICWKITIGLLIDNHPIPLGSLEVENTIVRIALANVMQYAYGLSAPNRLRTNLQACPRVAAGV